MPAPPASASSAKTSRTSVTSTARACAMPAQTPAITRSSARRAKPRQRHRALIVRRRLDTKRPGADVGVEHEHACALLGDRVVGVAAVVGVAEQIHVAEPNVGPHAQRRRRAGTITRSPPTSTRVVSLRLADRQRGRCAGRGRGRPRRACSFARGRRPSSATYVWSPTPRLRCTGNTATKTAAATSTRAIRLPSTMRNGRQKRRRRAGATTAVVALFSLVDGRRSRCPAAPAGEQEDNCAGDQDQHPGRVAPRPETGPGEQHRRRRLRRAPRPISGKRPVAAVAERRRGDRVLLALVRDDERRREIDEDARRRRSASRTTKPTR